MRRIRDRPMHMVPQIVAKLGPGLRLSHGTFLKRHRPDKLPSQAEPISNRNRESVVKSGRGFFHSKFRMFL